MSKIKKNDTVMVITGKDRGKTGKVLKIFKTGNKAVVEGINFVKKSVRKTRDNQQGGIVTKEAAIDLSNLAIFCKRCSKGTKVGYSILSDGAKSRFCKKCNEVF